MKFNSNPLLDLAFDFVQYTNRNVFLTGKAGTGKTTFLHRLTEISPKRMIVVAPTGVAAINAGGVTIHSFFQIGFGPQIPFRYASARNDDGDQQREVKRFNRNKIKIIRSLDLLVIDEVSMVRADLLDAVDDVLRRYRDARLPFGGVQLLLIGDLQQLSPVVKDAEWSMLGQYYDSPYFFSSLALKKTDYVSIELQEVFRQQDEHFIKLLNKVRENRLDREVLDALNRRYRPGFSGSGAEGYITLTTHNYQAADINRQKLDELPGDEMVFTAEVRGEFPEYSYPTDYELRLKVGAQVMFVKNDLSPEKRFFNGKIGVLEASDDGELLVKCDDDELPIEVTPLEWQNTKYTIDNQTQEIREEVAGSFIQIPLKLAWAITIHKSQGLTFERAIIDAAAAFAFGQVYVALSRCRTLEGLVLSSRITETAIHSDARVHEFNRRLREQVPDQDQLLVSRKKYQENLLKQLFDFSSLAGRLGYCRRIIRENAGSLTDQPKKLTDAAEETLRTQIVEVATKFNKQLDQLILKSDGALVEDNPWLQERIQKAGGYFSEKLKSGFMDVLDGLVVETDNKAVRKALKDGLNNLWQDCLVAHASLESCTAGFNVKRLLDARAKAGIEDTPLKTARAVKVEFDERDADDDLFAALKHWRHELATELGVPHYMIMHQKALIGIAAAQPTTPAELKNIKGVGKSKIKQYGEDILELVGQVTGKTIDFSTLSSPEKETKKKSQKPKGATQRETIGLFSDGKTIGEIAAARNLHRGTIVSHLAWGVREGLLDVFDVKDEKLIRPVVDFFMKNPGATRADAREALGEDVDWEDINLAKAYAEKLQAEASTS